MAARGLGKGLDALIPESLGSVSSKKAEPKAEVHFQFDGKDLVAKDVLDRAVKAYKSNHKGVEIKTIGRTG